MQHLVSMLSNPTYYYNWENIPIARSVDSYAVNVSVCPNEIYQSKQVEPIWQEQKKRVGQYLIGDLAKLVIDYAQVYMEQFHRGLLVRVFCETKWFIGKITSIVTVQSIPFLFIKYERFKPIYYSDWIPAESNIVKCFYDSQGNRIATAQFIKADSALSACATTPGIDWFDSELGIWRQGLKKHDLPPDLTREFAPLGTFTS
jgi:hypothetical protein